MWNLERHSHDCLEAICFLEGELTIRQGERQMEAAASSVVLHPPHAAHQEFPMPGKRREVIALWIQGGGGPAPGESFQLVDREACRLLVQSALSVEEIGLRVGFTDASYFWRSFRKETGYSPSAYRGRMRQRAESNTPRPGAFSD